MELNLVHRFIRRRFRVTVGGDNLPISSAIGIRSTLADLWNDLKYTKLAEIGVQRGEFSRELLTRVPNSHLLCVDPWTPYQYRPMGPKLQEQYYQQTVKNLDEFGDRVTILRMTSMEAVRNIEDNSLDAVFIDGDHTFDHAAIDIICWSNKVRSGGMIGVHDYYHARHAGVVQAVDAYTHCHKIDPWWVTRTHTSTEMPTAFWIKP